MSQLKKTAEQKIKNDGEKIRLLFTSDSLSISGIHSLILELIVKLNKKKFDCQIAVIKPLNAEDAFYLNDLNERNIPVKTLGLTHPQALFPIGVKRMKKIIKEFNPQIVLTSSLPDCFFVVRAAASMDVSIISIFNGLASIEGISKFKKRILLDHLEFSDGIIVLSEKDKKSYPREISIPIEVFSPVIDIRRFSPVSVRPVSQKKEFVLGAVVTWKDAESLPLLIEVFSALHKRLPFVKRLIIAGDGYEKSKIESLAKAHGIDKFVDMPGPIEDIVSIYRQIDFLLAITKNESMGMAVLEAMSCKVIPIARKCSVIPDIINHGNNGFYADIKEKSEIVDFLEGVLVDRVRHPAKFSRIAKAARDTIQEKFDTPKTVPKYEELFLRIAMNHETGK